MRRGLGDENTRTPNSRDYLFVVCGTVGLSSPGNVDGGGEYLYWDEV